MDRKNPAITVDIIVLTITRNILKILLIQRKNPPFRGKWALPGGFIELNESLEEAAKRELEEETGVSQVSLTPLKIFDKIGRDPRGRTISMCYWTVLNKKTIVKAGSDAASAKWFPIKKLPYLAFDHAEIINCLKKELFSIYQKAIPLFKMFPNSKNETLKNIFNNF